MRNRGVRHPERNAIICGVIASGGAIAIALGAWEMNAIGHETGRTASLIALGLFALIFGTAFFVNFLWARRIFRDLRSGRAAIARWTMPLDQFDRFRTVDQNFAERGEENDYRPPPKTPASGLEVIFSEDGVLIGDCYFGLATTGIARFQGVRLIQSDPPMIEFATVMTSGTNMSRLRIYNVAGTLRVPVAREATQLGDKVALTYQSIIERRVIVRPQFWTKRMYGGLVVAAVAIILAAVGFALSDRNTELGNIPLVLAVAGTMFAIGGLILALLAGALRRRQHRGP